MTSPGRLAARSRACLGTVIASLALSGCAASNPATGALREAVRRGDTEAAKSALARGADPNSVDDYGMALLHGAVMRDNPDVVAALLAAGVDSRLLNFELGVAARQGRADIVNLLLESGADIRFTNAKGETALHGAAMSPNPRVVEALVRAKVDVNARSRDGSTALLLATQNGYDRTVEALLAAGADPNVKNILGQSALDWAVARKQENLIALLSKAGGGNDKPAPELSDLKSETRALKNGGLRVSTTSLLTDGRFAMIRGTVTNEHQEAVQGIYYVVRILTTDSLRELDRFKQESSVSLSPGERTALRLDVESGYFQTGPTLFEVEAFPKKLGAKPLDPPPNW